MRIEQEVCGPNDTLPPGKKQSFEARDLGNLIGFSSMLDAELNRLTHISLVFDRCLYTPDIYPNDQRSEIKLDSDSLTQFALDDINAKFED